MLQNRPNRNKKNDIFGNRSQADILNDILNANLAFMLSFGRIQLARHTADVISF